MSEAVRTDAGRRRDRLAPGLARRTVVAGVAAPSLAAVAWVTRPTTGAPGVGGLVAGALVVAISTATLTTYVPAAGRRPELGCQPCAAAAAVSVVLAMGLLSVGATLLALAAAAAGLVQRLRRPASCAT